MCFSLFLCTILYVFCLTPRLNTFRHQAAEFKRLWALSTEGFLSCHTCGDQDLGFRGLVRKTAPFGHHKQRVLKTYFNPIKSHLRIRIFKTIPRFFGIKLTCYRCNNFETKYVVNDFPTIVLLSKQYDAFFMTSCRYEDCDYCRKKKCITALAGSVFFL